MYRTLSAPLNCQLEVTTECNNKCLHCYNHWRSSLTKEVPLSLANGQKIMHMIGDAGVHEVTFTGGEPLLNFDVLAACLELTNELGIKPYLNSNLVALTKQKAKILKDLGINGVLTSVIGPNAEVHDAIAQRKGAFKRTLKGVGVAQDAGIRVSANMVVSRRNLGFIKDTAKLVASIGIKNFNATKVGCPGNCSDFSDMSLTKDQFIQYMTELVAVSKETDLKCGHLEPYPLCTLASIDGASDLESRRCPAGITTCTISSGGDVRPCSHLDVQYGNLLVDGITEVWKRMDDWRRTAYMPQSCNNCKLITVCGGGCRMESKMHSSGDLSAADPYMTTDGIEAAMKIHTIKAHQTKPLDEERSGNRFRLRRHQIRKESFGAAVTVLEANSRVGSFFLNHAGLSVLEQFHHGCTYVPHDPRIDWSGIEDVEGFCTTLIKRGGAITCEKGGEEGGRS
jgi:radical SAM protein with 4Fe4S-binding SPASM domain